MGTLTPGVHHTKSLHLPPPPNPGKPSLPPSALPSWPLEWPVGPRCHRGYISFWGQQEPKGKGEGTLVWLEKLEEQNPAPQIDVLKATLGLRTGSLGTPGEEATG